MDPAINRGIIGGRMHGACPESPARPDASIARALVDTLMISRFPYALRIHAPVALLALAGVLGGCKQAAPEPTLEPAPSPAVAADAANTAPEAPEAPASSCPADDFDVFAERFGREISFQELNIDDPYQFEYIDMEAQPEPAPVVVEKSLDDVTWPLMPQLALLESQGRAYEISPDGEDGMQIRIFTPDTGDQQVYHFRRAPCWRLQRVVDESL